LIGLDLTLKQVWACKLYHTSV